MRKNYAFTLIEIMIVIAIILTLSAVLWLILGPAAKRKGIETMIRNDLHQFSVAINLYRTDYDDQIPASLDALILEHPTLSEAPSFTTKIWPECGFGIPLYYYTRPIDVVMAESKYSPRWPYDPHQNPIVKAPFYCRNSNSKKTLYFVDRNGKINSRMQKMPECLGVRLDGSIGWFGTTEQWEDEFAFRN